MAIELRIHEKVATVEIAGRFEFTVHQSFRGSVKTALGDPNIRELLIDLRRVDYLDSAALGMLLLTRENAAAANVKLALVAPSNAAKQVLDIANFEKLFSIQG